MMVEKAELAGYINLTGQKVSFLVPVYKTDAQFFLQEMGEGDYIVKGFSPLWGSSADRLIRTDATRTVNVGDPAIFAFQFPDRSIVTGTKLEITKSLRNRRRDLSAYPFVALAVARFIGDMRFGRNQVFKAAFQLRRKNRLIAHEWLEAEIRGLEPEIKQTHRTTFMDLTKDQQIFGDIVGRLRAGREVYVRLKLKRSAAHVSPKVKNLLTSFQLGKARIGKETRFLPVTLGTLGNIKQLSPLARILEVIELPTAGRGK